MDVPNRAFFSCAWTRPTHVKMEKARTPYRLATDDPEALLKSFGWSAEAGTVSTMGTKYGRCQSGRAAGQAGDAR
jgi:hypothetical protein